MELSYSNDYFTQISLSSLNLYNFIEQLQWNFHFCVDRECTVRQFTLTINCLYLHLQARTGLMGNRADPDRPFTLLEHRPLGVVPCAVLPYILMYIKPKMPTSFWDRCKLLQQSTQHHCYIVKTTVQMTEKRTGCHFCHNTAAFCCGRNLLSIVTFTCIVYIICRTGVEIWKQTVYRKL